MKTIFDEKLDFENEQRRGMLREINNYKYNKYWGSGNLLIYIAAILDTRNKMKIIKYYSSTLHAQEDVDFHINYLRGSLYRTYENYVAAHKSRIDNSQENLQLSKGGDSASGSDKGKGVVSHGKAFDSYISMLNTFNMLSVN